MQILTIYAAVGLLFISGCASNSPKPIAEAAHAAYAGRVRYTPTITRIPSGYRNVLPTGQAPEVTFLDVEHQTAEEMQALQAHLVDPLCNGDYDRFLAAIVVEGAYESGQISFSLWLHDGRHLDSGLVLLRDQEAGVQTRSGEDVGGQLYRHALSMLRAAIPLSKLEEAKHNFGPAL